MIRPYTHCLTKCFQTHRSCRATDAARACAGRAWPAPRRRLHLARAAARAAAAVLLVCAGRGDGRPPRGGTALLRARGPAGPRASRATRRCPTTSSRRTRTSSRSACARWPGCRRSSAASSSPTCRRRCSACRRARSSTATRSASSVGEALDLEQFRLRLTAAGYASVPQVGEPGRLRDPRLAVRRLPDGQRRAAAHRPVRRRSTASAASTPRRSARASSCERLDLLPAREFASSPESIRDFRRRFRTRFEGDLTRMPLYRDVGEGLAPAGIEYYLPLFFEQTADAVRLPARAAPRCSLPADHDAGLRDAWRSLIEARYEERRYDIEHPVLEPAEVFVPPDEWRAATAASLPHVRSAAHAARRTMPATPAACRRRPAARATPRRRAPRPAPRGDDPTRSPSDARGAPGPRAAGRGIAGPPRTAARPAAAVRRRGHGRRRLAASSSTATRASRSPSRRSPRASRCATRRSRSTPRSSCSASARARSAGGGARTAIPARIIQQLADLRPGAPVVHEDYGVGRYLGLTTMDAGGMPAEFLVLEYADGDKLYVPVQALERISRYTGAPAETAPLHKLGGDQWSKARARAAAQIRDAAAELLDVYARRAARAGPRLRRRRAAAARVRGRLPVRGDRRPGGRDRSR